MVVGCVRGTQNGSVNILVGIVGQDGGSVSTVVSDEDFGGVWLLMT